MISTEIQVIQICQLCEAMIVQSVNVVSIQLQCLKSIDMSDLIQLLCDCVTAHVMIVTIVLTIMNKQKYSSKLF